MVTEKNLILNLRNGSYKAFEQLYEMYSSRIFYFSVKYTHSQQDAEGVVQDVFIKLWENREIIDPDKSFSSYLFTISKNIIFNQSRKKLNEIAYRDYLRAFLEETSDDDEHEIYIKDLRNKLEKSIQQLPEKRRQIYLLSREDGLSYKEIAEKLQISTKTVEAQISLALKALRNVFNKEILFPLIFMLQFFA